MVQHVHASIPEYIYKRINKSPYKNKSEWISELLLRGIESWEKENIKKDANSSNATDNPATLNDDKVRHSKEKCSIDLEIVPNST